MIKIILLVLISFSSFAIVPGVLENKLSDKVVKVKFTRLGFSKSGICTASVMAPYGLLRDLNSRSLRKRFSRR